MSTLIKLPSYIYLYFLCQSINLMTAVISVTVAAAVGNNISSEPLYATIPYGMQFLRWMPGASQVGGRGCTTRPFHKPLIETGLIQLGGKWLTAPRGKPAKLPLTRRYSST